MRRSAKVDCCLDTMESLQPRSVIAGHKRVGNDDSPRIIEETRKYIRDFERLAMQETTRGNYMTRCSSCTLIGINEARSGVSARRQTVDVSGLKNRTSRRNRWQA